MIVSLAELELLNFYRVSELHGGLVLGMLARRVKRPELMVRLLEHSAEEIVHARLWTETLVAIGGAPAPRADTYQSRYAAALKGPLGTFEVLALTQVFERRVYQHFSAHLRRPGTHPVVRQTLARMLLEEKGHLCWVKQWLDEAAARGAPVAETLRQFSEVDDAIYATLCAEFAWEAAA